MTTTSTHVPGELSHALVEATDALVSVSDSDGRIILVNPALQTFTGRAADDLVGRPFWDVYVVPEDVPRARQASAAAIDAGISFTAEGDWLAAGGERRRVAMQNGVLRDETGRPYAIACIGIDVTAERRNEERMRWLATTDSLTGTRNRGALFEALTQHLGASTGRGCGLLFCDLDAFKAVNDRHGHAVGDRLLVEVAARLLQVTGPDDVVARFGGDEFVVLRPGTDEAGLHALAQRIQERMRTPLATPSGPLPIGLSIGAALAGAGDEPDDLIARADQRMYGSKARRSGARPAPG